MLDTKHYTFLLGTIGVPAGRALWLEYKTRQRWIDLSHAELPGRDLREYDLTEINLANAVLTGANLSGAKLNDANLEGADLRLAMLRGVLLERANLSLAQLEKATLVDARLGGSILRGACLRGATLTGADLAKADLIGADLREALLRYANLKGAMIEGVDIAGVDLTGALMDEDAPALVKNFASARVDDRRYREMRSRIAAVERGLVTVGEAGAAGGSGYRKPRFTNYAAARAAAETEGNGAAPNAAAARLEEGIPIRTVEPDLTTTEGCCEVLEIESTATKEQIVKAFRRKAKVYHPDKVRHLGERLQELAALEFQRLHLAYEQLTRGSTRPLKGIRWPEGFVQKASPSDYTIEEYERLAEFNPSSIDVLYNLAWKYFEAGRHRECMEGYNRVIKLNPKDEDARFNLMIVRLCMGLEDGGAELGEDTDRKRLEK